MNRLRVLLLCASAFLLTPASAEIYKYVDENGRVTYTNIPKKGSRKLDLDPVAVAKTRHNTGPENFPKVDNQTQRKRDDVRKQILRDELGNEEKSLADAQKALQEGAATRFGDEIRNPQKYQSRVAKLKENVSLHEKNILALKRELGEFN